MSLQKLLNNPTFFEEVTTKPNSTISEDVENKPNIYLIQAGDDVHVIHDIYCERIIYYYAFESHYDKFIHRN